MACFGLSRVCCDIYGEREGNRQDRENACEKERKRENMSNLGRVAPNVGCGIYGQRKREM